MYVQKAYVYIHIMIYIYIIIDILQYWLMTRKKKKDLESNTFFQDWGIPTGRAGAAGAGVVPFLDLGQRYLTRHNFSLGRWFT